MRLWSSPPWRGLRAHWNTHSWRLSLKFLNKSDLFSFFWLLDIILLVHGTGVWKKKNKKKVTGCHFICNYKSTIKIHLLDFTHTPSCLHCVIAYGMQIKTASRQESTTRLIHKARPGSIHDKIMPAIHSLPLLTHKFFSVQHTNVSTSTSKLSLKTISLCS